MGRAQVRALPGLMLAMLMGALDQTVMAPALPAVAGDLGGLEQMPFDEGDDVDDTRDAADRDRAR